MAGLRIHLELFLFILGARSYYIHLLMGCFVLIIETIVVSLLMYGLFSNLISHSIVLGISMYGHCFNMTEWGQISKQYRKLDPVHCLRKDILVIS